LVVNDKYQSDFVGAKREKKERTLRDTATTKIVRSGVKKLGERV